MQIVLNRASCGARGIAAGLLAGLLLATAAAGDIAADFCAEAKAVQSGLSELDAAWHRMTTWLPETDNLELVDLVLPGAVIDKDLNVRLYRVGGDIVRVRAWAPDWNRMEHDLVLTDFTISGDRKEGAIAGVLDITLLYDGRIPFEGKPLKVWFQIDATVKDGQIKGTFATTVPEGEERQVSDAKGRLSGSMASSTSGFAIPEGLPVPPTDTWNPYLAHDRSRVMAERAEDLYQDIRAIVIATCSGLPYAKAMEQTDPLYPYYEDFEAEKVAKDKRGRPKTVAPSVDDVDGGFGGELGDEFAALANVAPAPAAVADNPATRAALARIKHMHRRVATQLELVKAYENGGRGRKPFPITSAEGPDDPLFHPWYSTREPLAVQDGAHVLPPDAGAEGNVNWAPITAWKLIGPFPIGEWRSGTDFSIWAKNDPDTYPDWTIWAPSLPPVLADPDTKLRIDQVVDRKGDGRRIFAGPAIVQWKPTEPYNDFGSVAPPYVAPRNPVYGNRIQPPGYGRDAGGDRAEFLGETTIISDKDVELWAAFGVQERGCVWLNDELIWAGPADWRRYWIAGGGATPPDQKSEAHAFLKLPFRKGANRLRVSSQTGYASQYYWMRLCTHGQPRPAAESEAFLTKVAKAWKDLPPATTGFGLRGDQSAVFDAQPPLAWNLKRRQNIAWYTPLPWYANGSPVLAEDRLFVVVEPDRLFCLSKADGSILWERRCGAYETLPEPERQKAHELYDRWWAATQAREKVPESVMRTPKWIRNSHLFYWEENTESGVEKDERAGASPEMIALLDKKDELEANPDPQSVQAELTKVLEKIEKLREKEMASSPEFVKAQQIQQELSDAASDLIKFMSSHFGVQGLQGYWQDYDGYQFSTPITDGTHVWVKTGFGALACFDMEGNKKYIVAHGGLGSGSATIPSPLLVDGKIIMELTLREPGETRGGGTSKVAAFDAETGKRLWVAPIHSCGWGAGSPGAMRLTNGKDSMVVILSDGGTLTRADDGKTLAESIGSMNDAAALSFCDDIVIYTAGNPMTAFRLIMIDRDTVSFRPLWRRAESAQYHTCVATDGVLYLPGPPGEPIAAAPGEQWTGLRRFDVNTGARFATETLYRKAASFWCMSAASRDYVYHYGGDTLFNGAAGNKQPMTMAVIEKGPDGDEVAINAVERSYSGPVMENDRLYMRSYQGVTCVAYTGDEGKAYEARHVTETLLDQIPARRRMDARVKETRSVGYMSGNGALAMNDGLAPLPWLFAGPFPASRVPAVREEIATVGAWRNGAYARSTPVGSGWEMAEFKLGNLPGNDAYPWIIDNDTFTLVDRQRRRVIDLTRALKLEPETVMYLYTEMSNDKERVICLEQANPAITTWINGVEIGDGDRCKVPQGNVSVLLEIAIGKDVPARPFEISPRIWFCDDPDAQERAWVAFVKKHRTRLEQAVELAPDSPEGKHAAAVLTQL